MMLHIIREYMYTYMYRAIYMCTFIMYNCIIHVTCIILRTCDTACIYIYPIYPILIYSVLY